MENIYKNVEQMDKNNNNVINNNIENSMENIIFENYYKNIDLIINLINESKNIENHEEKNSEKNTIEDKEEMHSDGGKELWAKKKVTYYVYKYHWMKVIH